MKIIVCAKVIPGYITKLKVAETQDRVDYETTAWAMNESDEYALEAAVVLKREYGGEITLVSMGALATQRILYTGLAKGADEAMRIDGDFADSERVAKVLAEKIKNMEYDLILTGVESQDNMAAQVGVSLAERLGLPFAYAVTKIECTEDGKGLHITREVGGGVEQVMEIPLPALLCIQSGIVPLRYAPVQKILQARSKSIKSFSLSDLGFSKEEGGIKLVELFPPERKGGAEIIEGEPTDIAPVVIQKIKEVIT